MGLWRRGGKGGGREGAAVGGGRGGAVGGGVVGWARGGGGGVQMENSFGTAQSARRGVLQPEEGGGANAKKMWKKITTVS